jgi:Glu-tRNA(Gln) amidotransferase subunit E-like FAD-binding protein
MSWRVPEETANYLIRRGGAEIVDAVVEKTGVDGLLAGIVIGQQVKALKRRGIPMERLGIAEWIQVFDLLTDGCIPREAVAAVAAGMAQNGLDARGACAALGIGLRPREAWVKEAQQVTAEGYVCHKRDTRQKRARYLVGRAVKQLKGQAPAAEVAALMKELAR